MRRFRRKPLYAVSSMITIVSILDDKATVLELDMVGIYLSDVEATDKEGEPICSKKFLHDGQGQLIRPSMEALNPYATPTRDGGISLSLRDGGREFASGIVRGCLADPLDEHQS